MSTADIVNDWYRERLCGGPLGQHTEAYNQVVEALPDLIARLESASAKPKAAKPAAPAPETPDA